MSKLWLRKDNVSQSDLRRIQEEKAARLARESAVTPPSETEPPSENKAPSEKVAPLEIKPPSQTEPRSVSEPRTIYASPLPQNEPRSESEPPSETEPTRGFLKLTNHFVYDLMPTLKPTDGYVLLYLIARTHGFGKTRAVVTKGAIANACHISTSQVRVCMQTLAARKLIKYVIDRDNPNALERGYVVDMLVPTPPARSEFKGGSVSAPPSKSKPIKERTYERKSLNTAPPSHDELTEYERNRALLDGEGKPPA